MSSVATVLVCLGIVVTASNGFMTGGGPSQLLYEPVGCFRDNKVNPRPLPELIADFKDSVDANDFNKTVRACASETRRKGFSYFGLQSYSECWSGPNGKKTFARNGKSKHCIKGVGLSEANYVYRIVKRKPQKSARAVGSKARLVGGSTKYAGRVEVQSRGVWGTICNNQWDLRDANVVCRMLKFSGAMMSSGISVPPGEGPVLMDRVECEGHEDSLADCPSVTLDRGASQDCKSVPPAVAVCRGKLPASTGVRVPVRLVGGKSRHEGRVEVFYRRAWGTICDEGWDLTDGDVICRALGFLAALKASGGAKYGQGQGQIWLTRVNCTGRERLVHDCAHGQWGETACSHASDAGVECRQGRG